MVGGFAASRCIGFAVYRLRGVSASRCIGFAVYRLRGVSASRCIGFAVYRLRGRCNLHLRSASTSQFCSLGTGDGIGVKNPRCAGLACLNAILAIILILLA